MRPARCGTCARCSGISPRQKYRPASIERDRLLLGIPDRRPDVIG